MTGQRDRYLTKVKYKPAESPYILCEWEDEDGNEHSVKVHGPIHPDLTSALQGMHQHFVNVLNFGHLRESWKERWKVTAFERQQGDASIEEIRVTAHYRIEGGTEVMETLKVTTPWRLMPQDFEHQIGKIFDEAELVIDEAKTAQQAMFDDAAGDGAATDPPAMSA
jgi:hypothetical protein